MSEQPGDVREVLKRALTLKAYHALQVGPLDGPMKNEPALLLTNAHIAVDEAFAWISASAPSPDDELVGKLEAWASEEGYLAQHAPGIEADIYSERERLLLEAVRKLTSPPAPSGWQQQLKAAFETGMKWSMPWDTNYRQESADRGFALFLKGQNAKDALPPLSVDEPQRIAEVIEAALTKGVQFGLVEAQQLGALASRQWIVETTAAIVKDALPPAPESAPRWRWECSGSDGRTMWCCTRCDTSVTVVGDAEKRCPICDAADASPAKETP